MVGLRGDSEVGLEVGGTWGLSYRKGVAYAEIADSVAGATPNAGWPPWRSYEVGRCG